MKVSNHRLLRDDGTPYPYVDAPAHGGALNRRWLVMHYTADGGNTAVEWFKNPASRVSAHLVIARDGGITQMVPFDRVAFHAGKSEWKGVSGLNAHSIGIEMVNFGELVKHPSKGWMRYWDKWIEPAVPEAQVRLDGTKAVGGQALPRGWQTYTEAQLAAAHDAARAIVAAYALEDVLGHEEISPRRKTDPGPAFGIAKFRERVMRPVAGPRFLVTTTLNIHDGPSLTFPTRPGSPLTANTEVEELEAQGDWKRVAVRGGPTGWVPTTFLKAAPAPVGG